MPLSHSTYCKSIPATTTEIEDIMKPFVNPDGTTTCCNAYSSISIDDGVEYCKACYLEVIAITDPIRVVIK